MDSVSILLFFAAGWVASPDCETSAVMDARGTAVWLSNFSKRVIYEERFSENGPLSFFGRRD